MYNFNIPNNGWTCSKCGRSYAPHVSECVYCNSKIIKYLNSTTTAKPEWIYKENTSTGRVIDDWWNRPTTICWEDMIRRTGLLEDEQNDRFCGLLWIYK